MEKTKLQKLIYYKLNISPNQESETDIVASVIGEIMKEISKRYPWSFLAKKNTGLTLTSGQYQKDLPRDLAHVISVALIDSDNLVYPVHTIKPTEFDRDGIPDLDDTDRPYKGWVYWDDDRNPCYEFRPKSDGSYTVQLRYRQTLGFDDVEAIPNGLVIFRGVMAELAPPDQMNAYEGRYERGIQQMWIDDVPDLGEETNQQVDEATKTFNEFMGNLT